MTTPKDGQLELFEIRAARRLYPIAPSELRHIHAPLYTVRVKYVGCKRPPKKGEWFISGAVPEGYRATADMTTPYHIGRLVEIEEVRACRITREL